MLDFSFTLDYSGLATTELSPGLHPRLHNAEFRHVTYDKRALEAAEPRARPLFQPPPPPHLRQSYKK
jgi:hypothetical protein